MQIFPSNTASDTAGDGVVVVSKVRKIARYEMADYSTAHLWPIGLVRCNCLKTIMYEIHHRDGNFSGERYVWKVDCVAADATVELGYGRRLKKSSEFEERASGGEECRTTEKRSA